MGDFKFAAAHYDGVLNFSAGWNSSSRKLLRFRENLEIKWKYQSLAKARQYRREVALVQFSEMAFMMKKWQRMHFPRNASHRE